MCCVAEMYEMWQNKCKISKKMIGGQTSSRETKAEAFEKMRKFKGEPKDFIFPMLNDEAEAFCKSIFQVLEY